MSFPSFECTGTVHNWFRLDGGSWMYLGTCQVQPEVQITQLYDDFRTDTGGPMLPAQRRDAGQVGQIGLALNQYSRTNFALLRNYAAPGSRNQWSRGDLIFGKRTFSVVQQFEVPVNLGEPGWYWPQVVWSGEQLLQTGAGREDIRLLTFDAFPKLVKTNSYESNWVLYSHSIPTLTPPLYNE